LDGAGGLRDTPSGRRSYRDYLAWLSTEDGERKRLGFERMCEGWAKGDRDFKKSVLDDLKDGVSRKVVESEAKELREPLWERRLQQGLDALGKTDTDLKAGRKSADWKVALARHLRESTLVPNAWIADRLAMGTAKSVSSRVSLHRRECTTKSKQWKALKKLECVD